MIRADFDPIFLVVLMSLGLVLLPGMAFVVLVAAALVIPILVLAGSIRDIALIPGAVLELARDLRTRRNHSLEHATINVLEERFGPLPGTGGLAARNGFFIFTNLSPGLVFAAASEGAGRLGAGERELAIHPRCGTSAAVARLIFSLLSVGLLLFTGSFTPVNLLTAFVLAALLGPMAGEEVQRHLTTAPNALRLEVTGISPRRPAASWRNGGITGIGSYRMDPERLSAGDWLFISTRDIVPRALPFRLTRLGAGRFTESN